MVPLLREKGFYEHAEPRAISWPEYNLSQIREAKDLLVFIQDSVDKACSIVRLGQVGKPLTDAKCLAKAVLLCELLGFTERSAEGWLDILGPFLGVYEHLDDRVIGEAYGRVEVLHILKQVFEMSKTSDGKLSGDGTGLETSRKQNYENNKKAGEHMTSIVDSREVVQAFDISGKQECQIMFKLIEEVEGDSLRLDAGFVCRELTRLIDERGMIPYIFPKSNVILNGSLAWKNMYLELYYDVWQWLKEYHQRSHSET
jgi:transposase